MTAECASDAMRARSPWPEDERTAEVCGTTWQDAYAAAHARQLASASPRLAVFSAAGNGGLADRITGLMTVLLLAILTDRAIAIDWPGYEAALETPRVDATSALGLARRAMPSDVHHLSWLNQNRVKLRNLTEEVGALEHLWPQRVLIFQSNRGFTQGLLTSEHHSAAATARGLTPTNAQFGCLFNFLLRPTAASRARLAPFFDTISTAKARGETIIGVHVRTGDASFAKHSNSMSSQAEASGISRSPLVRSHIPT